MASSPSLQLRPADRANLPQVCRMAVAPEEQGFAAAIPDENAEPSVRPVVTRPAAGADEPVGFTMYGYRDEIVALDLDQQE